MSASKFTPEEIRLLKEHPYIIEVTPGKVCFSKEFKEIIWNKMQQGHDIHDIFNEYNIPCDLLGESRIHGMKYLIRKEGKAGTCVVFFRLKVSTLSAISFVVWNKTSICSSSKQICKALRNSFGVNKRAVA